MKRRSYFELAGMAALGSTLINPLDSLATHRDEQGLSIKNKKAQNIIFVLSVGMSAGTLNLANMYAERTMGKTGNWLQLYLDRKDSRRLMDMASASSIVTDSAAASSSWGGGFRVNNGSLNISPSGEEHLPIWQKFKLRSEEHTSELQSR